MADSTKLINDAFGAERAQAALDFIQGGAQTVPSVAAPVKQKGKPGRKPKADTDAGADD